MRPLPTIILILATALPALADQGKLYWNNGDALPGRLAGAAGERLRWQSPLFVEPLALELGPLESVLFEKLAGATATREPVRVLTRSGDILFGQLVAIDDKTVTLRADRHGEVKLRRDAVRSLRRLDHPSLLFLGPRGIDGWKPVGEQARPGYWVATPEGFVATKRRGAGLFLKTDRAEQVEIEVTVRGLTRPNCVIGFSESLGDAVRLETWDDEVVLVAGDNFEPVMTLGEKARAISLRLYWNHKTGELAAYAMTGQRLATMTAGASGSGERGFYLKNKGGELTLERLRVSKWEGGHPREVGKGENRIVLNDGRMVYGRVAAYSGDRRQLVLADDPGEPLAFDQVDTVYLADGEQVPDPKATVRVAYADGGVVSGTLLTINDGSIAIKTAFAEDPFNATLAGSRKLVFLADAPAATERIDTLYCDGGTLRGTLTGGGTPATAVQWWPVGGVNATALAPGCKARFVRGAPPPDTPAFDVKKLHDRVFLRSRDILPCRIEAIDEKFVHLESDLAEVARVPREAVQAIEYAQTGHVEYEGFGDDLWEDVSAEAGALTRGGGQIVMRSKGAFGHPSMVRGGDVTFTLDWESAGRGYFAVRLFAGDLRRSAASTNINFYCNGNYLYVYEPVEPGGRRGVTKRAELPESKAQLKITVGSGVIEVRVEDKLVQSFQRRTNWQSGRGIVFACSDRAHATGTNPFSVTVSKFAVRPPDRFVSQVLVDKDAKEKALTVPRFRKQSPPTHMLLAPNGDLLRGRLDSVRGRRVRFQSRLDDLALPRERVAAIVWLDPLAGGAATAPGPPLVREAGDLTVRVLLTGGEILSLVPSRMTDDRLFGRSPVLGRCEVPLSAIRELHVGGYGQPNEQVAYADWRLIPAPEPDFGDGVGDSGAAAARAPVAGTQVQDFELPLLGGGKFKLGDYADRVVVLDFWATWCGPCVRSMPAYLKVLEGFDLKKVAFVGMNQAENRQVVEAFLKKRNWKMTVAMDANQAVARQFGVGGIPHTVVLDRGGVVAWTHVGYRPGIEDELKAVIQKLLD